MNPAHSQFHKRKSHLINKKISVHAYKFNGWLYRSWEFPKVIAENEDYLCVWNQGAHVITSDEQKNGHFFHSKINRPCLWYFFKKEWFNMIVSLRNENVHVYINLASPFIIEDNTIKYIDFDIDYLMSNAARSSSYRVLDLNEYQENASKYHYTEELKSKIKKACEQITISLKQHHWKHLFNKETLLRMDQTSQKSSHKKKPDFKTKKPNSETKKFSKNNKLKK